jgi:hypothetical protein
MNAPLRVFSIEVVEAPNIALVVATRSLLGSAELEKLGDSPPLSFQKNARSPIFAQSSIRVMTTMERPLPVQHGHFSGRHKDLIYASGRRTGPPTLPNRRSRTSANTLWKDFTFGARGDNRQCGS